MLRAVRGDHPLFRKPHGYGGGGPDGDAADRPARRVQAGGEIDGDRGRAEGAYQPDGLGEVPGDRSGHPGPQYPVDDDVERARRLPLGVELRGRLGGDDLPPGPLDPPEVLEGVAGDVPPTGEEYRPGRDPVRLEVPRRHEGVTPVVPLPREKEDARAEPPRAYHPGRAARHGGPRALHQLEGRDASADDGGAVELLICAAVTSFMPSVSARGYGFRGPARAIRGARGPCG